MATSLAQQAAEIHNSGSGGQPQIPDDVEFYQPYEVDQITLPERAQCLAVKAFLKMCDIPFLIKLRSNAEHMSPSGVVPFIKAGSQIISEFDPIVEFLSMKGVSLSEELSGGQKSEMKAYMALSINRLYLAELFLAWNVKKTADEVTKPRYGSPYPWPLDVILPFLKQREIMAYLKAQSWHDFLPEQVYDEVNLCCKALSDKLGEQNFFFLDRPTELDALVYGHLKTLQMMEAEDERLARMVNKYDNLVRFCDRIRDRYFIERERSR
ncbi:metaxin-2-like [Diadema antillarum]|uniref:metaxin-2-like n=1 Tax=Diadema antillarum TaxID=105358 RepID=UPI003A8C7092